MLERIVFKVNERTMKRATFLIDVAYVAVIAFLAYLVFKYVAGWVMPFILAFCIVALIHPLVNRIVKLMGINQKLVAFFVMALVYAIIGTLSFLLVLQLIFAVRDAFTLLPDYYTGTVYPALTRLSESFDNLMGNLPVSWRVQAESMQSDMLAAIQSFLLSLSQRGITALSAFTGSIPSFLIGFLFTIMLSFFISMQYDSVVTFIKTQMPPRAQKTILDIKLIILDTVVKYLRATLTLMVITFAGLVIGLLALKRPNAIPIAAGIALFDALPFFGTGGIIFPWALVELVRGNYPFAVGLVVLYACIAFIRSISEPKIVGDKLGLNPVVSLTAIYLGYRVFGVLGMIVMPIVTQIILELHRKGSIRIFRETTANNSGTGVVAGDTAELQAKSDSKDVK